MDETIVRLAQTFTERHNVIFGNYPKYYLDLTWPSVGVIDLLTRELRGKKDLTPAEDGIVLASSAYLAMLAFSLWKLFHEDFKPTLVFKQEPRPTIRLEGRGGPHLPHDHKVSIDVTNALREILRHPPSPFPFFEQFSRPLPPDHNLISLFALGLMTGLSPYAKDFDDEGTVKSAWTQMSASQLKPHIQALEIPLAAGSSAYYMRNFPGEPFGQEFALYRLNLIFPPAGYKEAQPGARAAAGLAAFMEAKKLTSAEKAALADNLGLSPDELISTAGFCVSCALSTDSIRPSTYNLCHLMGSGRAQLRPAVLLARQTLGFPSDFTHFMSRRSHEPALKLASIDQRLGLVPLFRLPLAFLRHPEFLPLVIALAGGQETEALELLELLLATGSGNVELLLQQSHLYLLEGRLEEAEQALRFAEKAERLFEPFNYATFLDLAGTLHSSQRQFARAIPLLEKCLTVGGPDHPSFRSAAHLLCWSLALEGHVENAEKRAAELLAQAPHLADLRVLHLKLLEQIRREDWEDETRVLARALPTSPHVFQAVLRLEESRQDL